MTTTKDMVYLNEILEYCVRVRASLNRINDDFEVFKEDIDIQQSICFSISQIGDLVSNLSAEFIWQNPSIPWKNIRDMRILIAHHYGSVNTTAVWNTAHEPIQELNDYINLIVMNVK